MSFPPEDAPEELKDEVLLRAAVENPSLFEILVRRYQEAFLRAAMRVVRRREDAEDIVQEAFVKMYRNAHRFEKRDDVEFKSWAYRIVLNTAFTHYQRLKRQSIREDYEGDEMLRTVVSEHDDLKRSSELKILIEQVLADLPEDLARVLRRHYLEDKAYEAIAATEHATVASIKMRLYRARQAFKKHLGAESGHTN
ncbi:MAG: sigma-70 family RNA polymerase sigma factor [Candidatus Sungbacteria bacterium]|nr:sigma-70 family RNA polymerase sigma factor [Candidatus Sungbacteria bacterium]